MRLIYRGIAYASTTNSTTSMTPTGTDRRPGADVPYPLSKDIRIPESSLCLRYRGASYLQFRYTTLSDCS